MTAQVLRRSLDIVVEAVHQRPSEIYHVLGKRQSLRCTGETEWPTAPLYREISRKHSSRDVIILSKFAKKMPKLISPT